MLEPRELTIGEDLGLSMGLAMPFSSKGGCKREPKQVCRVSEQILMTCLASYELKH